MWKSLARVCHTSLLYIHTKKLINYIERFIKFEKIFSNAQYL